MSHTPLPESLGQLNILAVWKVSRISPGNAEHFCFFQTGGSTKTLSDHKRSSTTSEIMFPTGLPGHRRTNWVSSAWKILFSSLVTSWAAAAFVDDIMEAEISLETRTFNNGRSSFVWSNFRGPVSYQNSCFEPVRSPCYVLSAHIDVLFFIPWEAEIDRDSGPMCLHQGLSNKVRPLPDQANPN